jgi:phthalate 4,5-cis-dihydrodiol dehydrogenase
VKITAGADVRPAALEQFAREFGARTYGSVEALCGDPNVDAVYILSPNRFHAEHAILAAEHGKQVFADKPMATSLEDCDRMIAAAERNGVRLLVGHTQSLDLGIQAMARLVNSGELGQPLMFQTWYFNDWLYRPRTPDELDPANGEGIVMRQGPVQADILRMLGGGRIRSVRAMSRAADPSRPVAGAYTAYLEFDDGTPATMVYNATGHFDTSELTGGIGAQFHDPGGQRDPEANLRARRRIRELGRSAAEAAYKDSMRYGGSRAITTASSRATSNRQHSFFGLTIASCERGDVRQTPAGLLVYGDDEVREVPVSLGEDYRHGYTSAELNLMIDAWSHDRPLASHDGAWGKATLEVILGIVQSARERREIMMSHQTHYRSTRDD